MKSTTEVVQEIAAALSEADGDYIEQIYNQLFDNPVKYIGDSMFTQESE